jgi:hypothetical protein
LGGPLPPDAVARDLTELPAKGQVARVHRELARVAGIERRGKDKDDEE